MRMNKKVVRLSGEILRLFVEKFLTRFHSANEKIYPLFLDLNRIEWNFLQLYFYSSFVTIKLIALT
jgi:hypothetical protein